MVALLFSAAIEDCQSSQFYARLSRFIHDTWQREDKYSFWFNSETNKDEIIDKAMVTIIVLCCCIYKGESMFGICVE